MIILKRILKIQCLDWINLVHNSVRWPTRVYKTMIQGMYKYCDLLGRSYDNYLKFLDRLKAVRYDLKALQFHLFGNVNIELDR
jgi:hypothetical protein